MPEREVMSRGDTRVEFQDGFVTRVSGTRLMEEGQLIDPEQAGFSREDGMVGCSFDMSGGSVHSLPEKCVQLKTFRRGKLTISAVTTGGITTYTLGP